MPIRSRRNRRGGVCVTVLGIPLLEDRECRNERLEAKAERQAQRQDSRSGRVEERQTERTERVAARQEGRSGRVEDRTAPDATVPAAETLGQAGDVLGDIARGLGGGAAEGIPVIPIVAGVGLVLVASSIGKRHAKQDRKRRGR